MVPGIKLKIRFEANSSPIKLRISYEIGDFVGDNFPDFVK
jgi:hypothetical protein